MGITPQATTKTIQSFPANTNALGQQPIYSNWLMQLATAADTFTPWGQYPWKRDMELRQFWPTESILAGAVATIAARNAAITIKFDGPPRTVKAVQEMWNLVNFGKGPQHLLTQNSIDLYTQDNAAFFELIRSGPRETNPVISIAHRDAAQVRRTGNPDFPFVYIDPRNGTYHKLGWWQMFSLEEMPAPIETMNGMQYCALTRVLRAAQIMRDLEVYEGEEVSGRGSNKIHLVGGVMQSLIEDAQKRSHESADNQGLMRYMDDIILASLDPTATVSHVEISLKSLPPGYDKAEAFKQYIACLALGFLEDYQTFAPLPGGHLGTSHQSEVLDRKAQGKGPGLYNKLLIHALMYYGVFPQSVEVSIEERDLKAEADEANVKLVRAQTRAARITSGEINAAIARQLAQDEGDLQEEYLAMLNEQDTTEDITVTDDERVESEAEVATEVQNARGQLVIAPTQPAQLPAPQGKALRSALRGMREAIQGLRVANAPQVKEQSLPTTINVTMPAITLPAINLTLPETKQAPINIAPQPLTFNIPPPRMTVSHNMKQTPVIVNVAAPHVTNNVQPTPIENIVNVPLETTEEMTVLRNNAGLIERIRKVITRQ